MFMKISAKICGSELVLPLEKRWQTHYVSVKRSSVNTICSKISYLFKPYYPYMILSDISEPSISGKLHISGHKLPCSMNNANILSSTLSELLTEPEAVV